MQILVRKNLVSHRHRNKLTSIIYSLTLGAVIFMLVSSTITLKQLTTGGAITNCDLYLHGPRITRNLPVENYLLSNETDPVLVKYKDKIKDFVYLTGDI